MAPVQIPSASGSCARRLPFRKNSRGGICSLRSPATAASEQGDDGPVCPVARSPGKAFGIARNKLLGLAWKHRFHLGLQRSGVERLDDVVADPGLLRGNDVFGL